MLSADTYNLWFAPLRACSQENNSIILEVANDFCEVWLKDNYMGLLQDVIALASGRQLQVKFKVGAAGGASTPGPQAVQERAGSPLPPPAADRRPGKPEDAEMFQGESRVAPPLDRPAPASSLAAAPHPVPQKPRGLAQVSAARQGGVGRVTQPFQKDRRSAGVEDELSEVFEPKPAGRDDVA